MKVCDNCPQILLTHFHQQVQAMMAVNPVMKVKFLYVKKAFSFYSYSIYGHNTKPAHEG